MTLMKHANKAFENSPAYIAFDEVLRNPITENDWIHEFVRSYKEKIKYNTNPLVRNTILHI